MFSNPQCFTYLFSMNSTQVSGDWEGLEVGPCQCQSFPEKFRKLDRFFSDLCTAYGKRDTLKSLGVNGALDIFIVCTG